MTEHIRLKSQPLQQDPAYSAALRRFGAQCGKIDGLLSLHRRVLGVPITMIPRFDCDHPDRLLAALPAGPVILSLESPCPELTNVGAIRLARPTRVAILPLSDDEQQMRRALHQKWRNRLRHAERHGLKLRVGRMPADPGHWLIKADEDQARDRGYRGWPTALTCAWARDSPSQTLLVQARDRRGHVAAMLFLLHGKNATYHMGHTTDRGRASSAHNLVLWRAMQELGSKGYKQIDLGLLHTDTIGLNRFKLQTGAKVHTMGGTWLMWRFAHRFLGRLPSFGRRRAAQNS